MVSRLVSDKRYTLFFKINLILPILLESSNGYFNILLKIKAGRRTSVNIPAIDSWYRPEPPSFLSKKLNHVDRNPLRTI
ncbi:hypothetical protein AAY473_038144 [Plecturocebus cupreus]